MINATQVQYVLRDMYTMYETLPMSRQIGYVGANILNSIYSESDGWTVNATVKKNGSIIRTIKNDKFPSEFLEQLWFLKDLSYTEYIREIGRFNNAVLEDLKNIQTSDNHTDCERCNESIDLSKDTYKNSHYRFYCNSCSHVLFKNCAECNEITSTYFQDGRMFNNDTFCNDCFWDNFKICSSCDGTIETDNAQYDDHSDGHYCEQCYNELDRLQEFECKKLDLKGNTFIKLRNKRCFGIELEVDNKDINYGKVEDTTCFGCKYDGSLNVGGEIYSPILQGDKGYAEVKKVCDILKNLEVSRDSGYHLHIDSRDLDWRDIKKVWLTCRILEPLLLHILPESRRGNSYCKQSRHNIKDILNIKNREELSDLWYGGDDTYDTRYRGLNIHAWFVHNTVELRYHTGTVKFDEVMNWIKMNLAIFQFALSNDIETIIKLLDYNRCKTNYTIIRKIFNKVVQNKTIWKYYKVRYLQHSKKIHGDYFPERADSGSFRRVTKLKKSSYKIDVKVLEKIHKRIKLENLPITSEKPKEMELILA